MVSHYPTALDPNTTTQLQLVEQLEQTGLLYQDQITHLRQLSRHHMMSEADMADTIVSWGWLPESAVLQTLAAIYQTQYVSAQRLERALILPETLSMLPAHFAEQRELLPVLFDQEEQTLSIVTPRMLDEYEQHSLASMIGVKHIRLYLSLASTVRAAIQKYYQRAYPSYEGYGDVDDEVTRLVPRYQAPEDTSTLDSVNTSSPQHPKHPTSSINLVGLVSYLLSQLKQSDQEQELWKLTESWLQQLKQLDPWLRQEPQQETHLRLLSYLYLWSLREDASPQRRLLATQLPQEWLVLLQECQRLSKELFQTNAPKAIPFNHFEGPGAPLPLVQRIFWFALFVAFKQRRPGVPSVAIEAEILDMALDWDANWIAFVSEAFVRYNDTQPAQMILLASDDDTTYELLQECWEQSLSVHWLTLSDRQSLSSFFLYLEERPEALFVFAPPKNLGEELLALLKEEEHTPQQVLLLTHGLSESLITAMLPFVRDILVSESPTLLVRQIQSHLQLIQEDQRQEQGQGALQGQLLHLPLPDLLQLLSNARRSGAILLQNQGQCGHIFLEKGQVVHVIHEEPSGTKEGEEAIISLLKWEQGMFQLFPEQSTASQSIRKPLEALLLDSLRMIDEERR